MNSEKKGIKNGKGVLSLFCGILIMMCLGTVYSWSIFRGGVEELYGIGTTLSGLPYMFSLAFYALFMFLTGKYIEKYSPAGIILFGGILVGAGWLLSGTASNIYILTVTYGVVIGAGVGIIYGVPMNAAAKWFPDKKGLIVGLVLLGFGLSPFVTAPFAGYLVEMYGVLKTFTYLGILFGISIPLLGCLLKYPVKGNQEEEREKAEIENAGISMMEINKTGIDVYPITGLSSFRKLYLNFTIGTMIGLLLVGMTGTIGTGLIGIDKNRIALYLPVFAVFNGIGRPVFGWLTDQFKPKRTMLLSFGLIMGGAVLMLTAGPGNLLIFIVAFSIFWMNLGGWLAIAPAATMSLFGTKYYSRNYGIVFTAYGIGAVIGVLISGFIMDYFKNFDMVFYFVLLLSFIGIISVFLNEE